jgi:hypothetical protein
MMEALERVLPEIGHEGNVFPHAYFRVERRRSLRACAQMDTSLRRVLVTACGLGVPNLFDIEGNGSGFFG